ncbi:unnamed protein product [Owenia fusiformis]|uniref:Uncharacterized protein n=1 Tax=Owenia fusiformis TaxID=6347 RepID=A0A8J1TIP6_OWEFU|nr:unnamed protein product [Owenia fusiformis]
MVGRFCKVLIGLVYLRLLLDVCTAQGVYSRCYDTEGRAKSCMPGYENAAFNVPVKATNTCGEKSVSNENGEPIEYCKKTGYTQNTCSICNASDAGLSHPATNINDLDNYVTKTWWQSETMLQGNVQYPSMVNITLNLGKSFDITALRIKFKSSRPESFAIYNQETEDGDWIPYQFYSASCEETYGKSKHTHWIISGATEAICTDKYSDISPSTGGIVMFSTLEKRPGARKFEESDVLQKWVTARGIRLVLSRINTWGDEVFGEPQVLKSYFYAISDISVGGRCKCNGHAGKCVNSTEQGLEGQLVCSCEHNTTGPDCGECLPFYNNKPWKRATDTDGNACEACNCNGKSDRCYFDQSLFEASGEGGHCLNCRENTTGPHCENCKENYYLSQEGRCENCACNSTGSENLQCDRTGQCRCKPGVEGKKCDRCSANYYGFSSTGCKECACLRNGSLDVEKPCHPDFGTCHCDEFANGTGSNDCRKNNELKKLQAFNSAIQAISEQCRLIQSIGGEVGGMAVLGSKFVSFGTNNGDISIKPLKDAFTLNLATLSDSTASKIKRNSESDRKKLVRKVRKALNSIVKGGKFPFKAVRKGSFKVLNWPVDIVQGRNLNKLNMPALRIILQAVPRMKLQRMAP